MFVVHDNPASSNQMSWEEFSASPRAQFPPLMELTARFIAQQNIPWKAYTLPKSLTGELPVNDILK